MKGRAAQLAVSTLYEKIIAWGSVRLETFETLENFHTQILLLINKQLYFFPYNAQIQFNKTLIQSTSFKDEKGDEHYYEFCLWPIRSR